MPTELNNMYLASGGKLALAFGTSATKVYGSVDADTVTIAAGVTAVLDGSFNRGNDIIQFTGNAASYSIVKVNASTVKITDAAGTSVTIPVGSTGTHIQFADADRVLSGSSAGIVLGDQSVTSTAASLNAGTAPAPVEAYTLSVNAPTVTEGDTGSKTMSYKLTLDKAPTSTVTVNYETLDTGTATANDDFVPAAGSVTFAAGQTVAFVSVTVLGDTILEVPETIKLNLSGSKLVAAVQATGTIVDNETAPVDQTSYTVTAGQIATADAQNVPVTVDVGNTGNKTVTIQSDADSANRGVIIDGNATVSVTAGAAGDIISVSGNANNTIDAGGGTGNDTVNIYGSGNNTIYVGKGNDTVVGGTGNDTIVVGAGDLTAADDLDGGAGEDTVRISGDGNVAIFGTNLKNIEHLVLDGTSVTITEASLEAAITAGLLSIEGHSDSSVITVTSAGGAGAVIDLTGLTLSGVKELKVDGAANVTIKLSESQIAAIGKISDVAGNGVPTINTTVAGYQALGAKAPGVTVTITDTAQNLIAAGNSISGVTATIGNATVAEAQSALASGLTVSYTLVDSAANLALASVAVYNSAVAVTVTGTATSDQATAIQGNLAAANTAPGGVTFDAAKLTMTVADSASNVSNYLTDTIDADSVTVTGGETLTVAQAAALYAINSAAVYKIKDTAANLAAAGNTSAMNHAAEITATGALTVTQVGQINAGTVDIKPGYALTDGYAALTGASASVIANAGNLTVNGGTLTVAQAMTVETLANGGTKSYTLSDTMTALLAAGSNVVADASAIAATDATVTVSQLNQLVSKYGTTKVADVSMAVSDTLANLLTLSAGSVGEASSIAISSGVGTVANIVALKALTGAKMPTTFTVTDSYANLSAALADPTQLALLDVAGATINVSGSVSAANVKALNDALTANAGGQTTVNTGYALSDTAANLALGSNNAIVTAAASVAITGNATVAQHTTISGLNAAVTSGYSLSDTASNLVAGTTAVDGAGTVTVTNAATVSQIVTIAASYTATGPDAVYGTDLIYSISDAPSVFDGANAATLAILNGATSATMVGTVAQVFAGTLTTAERDVADVIVVQDTLTNLGGLTTGQLAEVDRLTVSDTNLIADAATATAVNALAAAKPTTYTINDTLTHLTAPTGTTAEKAAIATLVLGAANVVVDSNNDQALTGADTALTVAQFNTLDALTNGTIKANVTGTVAQLSAADAATAISSAVAASATVTVTNTAANVSQAETLKTRLGAAHSGVTSLVVTDTAANIQAATSATVAAVNSFVVSDNGTITGSATLLGKVYGTDGSSYGNYAISDTATNIVNANTTNANFVKFAQSVTVTGTATQSQAGTLSGLKAMGAITYSISDTAANIAGGSSAGRNSAINITATDAATVAQAATIDAATNTGSTSYAISDTASAVATSNAGQVAAIEHATGTVTATGNATAAQATTIAAFTKAVVYSVSDVPSALAASTGLNEAVNVVSTGATATAAEAATIMAATNSGTTTISAVSGTSTQVKALTLGSNDTITTLTVTGTTTATDATLIAAKDLGANIGTLAFTNISGTYAEIKAAAAAVNLASGTVTVTDAMTIAQAIELDGLITPALSYSITDSLNNIMADTTPGGSVDNAAVFAGKAVTVTDASLTIDQATALRGTGASSYTYAIKDNDANLVTAINASSAALSGATSVTSADGTVLSLATIGGQLSIVGSKAALSTLSSVLQGAEKVYEVSVADLAATPDFFIGLNAQGAYRVTDTISNLTGGNALLPNAVALVATTAATVAQATTLNSLGAMAKTYDVTDTASAISGASGASSVIDGARNVVVTGTATFAQANTIEAETNSGTLTINISDSGANVGAASSAALNAAGSITATGSTTAANAATLLAATNTGATTIALVTGTSAQLAGLTLTSNDTITSMTPSDASTVAQLTAMSTRAAAITAYSLSDTAAHLAGATSAQLNGATNIASSDAVTVALATTLDAATNTGTTTFDISDTAANVLAGSATVLGADADGDVIINDTTVTASVATQLRALDTANASFAIKQGGTAGVFVISDTVANLTATANAAAVAASTDVRITGTITVADANLVRAAATSDAAPTYNLADTYSRLVAGLATTVDATNVTVTNQVTVSQANSAVANFSAATLTMSVRDTASAVSAGLAASSAGLAAAAQVSVSTSATVAQAAYLSELSASQLVGGYSITDSSANVTTALNTGNGTNFNDRGTILGATAITLTDAATVAQALGVRGSESRGLYTIPGISYAITDSAANIIAGLAGSDAAGIDNATSVQLSSSTAITVSNASTLTALANFDGYDGNGAYAIGDVYTSVQAADTALVLGAASVRANGAAGSVNETIDMTGIGRAVYINGNGGNDSLFGTDFADTLDGGTGADTMTGGSGRDAFWIDVTSPGDNSTAAWDNITDFTLATATWTRSTANDSVAEFQASTVGGLQADILDLDTAGTLAVEANGTGAGVAANTTYTVTNGILTLSGSGASAVDTLGEWLLEAAAVAATDGETLAFEVGGNTYVFTHDTASDSLVELTAVTGVAGLSLVSGTAGLSVGGAGYVIIG